MFTHLLWSKEIENTDTLKCIRETNNIFVYAMLRRYYCVRCSVTNTMFCRRDELTWTERADGKMGNKSERKCSPSKINKSGPHLL